MPSATPQELAWYGQAFTSVAEYLGHSDVQTARTYGKWADGRIREHMQQS